MRPVTDHALLAELNQPRQAGLRPVTDPALLAELDAGPREATAPPTPIDITPNMGRAMRAEMAGRSWLANNLASFGNFLRGPYEGARQLLGAGDRQAAEGVRTLGEQAPVGEIAGNVAGFALPGLRLAFSGPVRAIASGAAQQFLQPTREGESRGMAAAGGAAGGIAGYGLAKGVGRILNPQTRAAAKALADEGVRLTPGQILGGAAQRVEDAATSLPFAGDVIRGAKVRATADLNRAAYNRVLKPLGQTVDDAFPVGREGVEEVSKRVSDAYHSLLPGLRVQGDAQFGDDLLRLRDAAKNLPPDRAAQFDAVLKNELVSRFTPSGLMTGETMKQVDSKLGQIAANYRSSADPDQRALGGAVRQAQKSLREMVARANPDEAPRLSAINEAYSKLIRVERAAGALGARDGVFSGAQLTGAVRAKDRSLNKRAFAQGKALMQDLGEAGKDVLGSTVPDSGTPFRLINLAAMGGAPFIDPSILAVAAALGAGYTNPGQAVLRAALMRRPDVARYLGSRVSAAARLAAPAGASLPGIVEQ